MCDDMRSIKTNMASIKALLLAYAIAQDVWECYSIVKFNDSNTNTNGGTSLLSDWYGTDRLKQYKNC